MRWAARLSVDISTRVRCMARTANGSSGLFPVPGRKSVWKFAGSNCEKTSSVVASQHGSGDSLVGKISGGGDVNSERKGM